METGGREKEERGKATTNHTNHTNEDERGESDFGDWGRNEEKRSSHGGLIR
jgi:hypothetical protein